MGCPRNFHMMGLASTQETLRLQKAIALAELPNKELSAGDLPPAFLSYFPACFYTSEIVCPY